MRRTFTLLHRWLGLFSALFLFVAGFTGAFISWDHELDAALNPKFYRAAQSGPALDPARALALADQLEREDPRLQVSWLPLAAESGKTALLGVTPRLDPKTSKAHELDFNQVALDPASGGIQAQREWGRISLARADILPFLYKLHYSMHLPEGFGQEWGVLFMGVVALVWVLDCLLALYISFPSRLHWQRSLRFRLREGGHKLNFDLHRSGGVWAWLLLLTVAITAVSMNLHPQLMRPLVSVFSTLTPSPFDSITAAPKDSPHAPKVARTEVLAKARAEAQRRGWAEPAGGMFFDEKRGVYGVGFFHPENDHGDGGLGNAYLYYLGADGSYAGDHVPGTGSAGDIFLQAQFPLHSGRIFGIAGRVAISVLGALVAMLSITGVVIWARRQRTRARSLEERVRMQRLEA